MIVLRIQPQAKLSSHRCACHHVPPVWPGGECQTQTPQFGGFKAKRPLLPAEIAHHSKNWASPKASRCPLVEVSSLGRGLLNSTVVTENQNPPESQATPCGSPCDPNWEALPLVSRLSGCVISGINTAVFVSPHSAPDRAAARPAACSWSLAPWHGRHQGPEEAPPDRHGHWSRQSRLEATEVPALQSQEGKRASRNLQAFPLRNGVGQGRQDSLEPWEVHGPGP